MELKKKKPKQTIPLPDCRKVLRVITLTLVSLLLGTHLMQAELAYAQHTSLELNLRNATLEEVFDAIRNQSEFEFFYSNDKVNTSMKVNVNLTDADITDVLNQILPDMYEFEIKDRYILINKKKELPPAMSLSQQNDKKKISGVITDKSGEPLIGANVIEKGTTNGTVTDLDGNFTLSVPENTVLQISYIGYAAQEINIDNQTQLTVVLVEDSKLMDEIVVVGFGTQKKTNLTGAVSVVKGDEMNKRPVANASAMLQSQIPGLRVQIGTGEPGNQNISFRIRGQGTFSSAGSDPLILINGVPGSLDNIDPNTVESVSVLKDAASAAVYGARAANGVVLVTTKTGENMPLTVSYRGNMLWTSPTRMFDLVTDPAEYMTLYNQAADNSGRAPGDRYSAADITKYRNREAGYEGYDWMGENITTSLSHNHNLTLLGGTDKLSYNAALNYADEKGTMKAFDHQKYNFTLNMQSKLSKRVTAGSYVNMNRYDRSSPRQGSEDAFLALMSQAPTYGPQRSDGTWTKKAYMFEDPNKNVPAIIGNEALKKNVGYESSGHLWLTVNLFEGLSWHTKGAATMRTTKYKDWRPIVPVYMYHDGADAGNLDVGGKGFETENTQTFYTYLYSYLKYDFALAGQAHKFGLQFGYSQESNKYETLKGYRDTYNFPLFELDAGSSSMQENSGKTEEWALMGIFGRFNYNFKERYLFEANFRHDGTSRISPEGRWGTFPSLSAGWRITEESFVKNIIPQWVNNIKIRGSWGQLGNQNIGLYPWQALIQSGENYTFDNVNLPTGYAQKAMANRNLTWETTTTTDVGLDITLFNGLNATLGWYKKETTDILRESQLTGIVGLTAPTVNNGGMTNTGIELDLRYNGYVKNGTFKGLSYSAGFYLDSYRNELTDFGAREIDGYKLREEGRPWDSYYLLDCIGVFATPEEIINSPKQFNDDLKPGDLKYRDADGDGDVDADDRIVVDGRFPSMEYAFSASAAWKGFDISLLMGGVSGKKWFVDWWGTWPFLQASPPTRAYIDGMWTEENPYNAKHPKLYLNDIGGDKNKRASTYYLQDASFMRVKNLTIGYTLPSKFTQKMNVRNLRIYFSGDNLFTFTGYPELDPERGDDGRMVKYPQNKVLSLGLNVTF